MIVELPDHLLIGGFLLIAIEEKRKFNHMKKLISLVLTATLLSGCASIVKGSRQTINISTSTGKQADAIITTSTGQQNVVLPQAVPVKTDNMDITVNIKETRCNNASTTIVQSRLHPWFWGNVILRGVFGSTTDSVSGSMWTYDESVIVNVTEKDSCKVK